MPVISFASSKGGAGKTTSCIVLGSEISESTTVAMIDADPAQRMISWSKKGDLPDNIEIISCTDENKIMDVIADAQSRATVVLVDLEGVASRLNTFAVLRSDLVIIPMGDEQQDADAAVDTMAQVRLDGQGAGRAIETRVLFTRVKAAVKSSLQKDINGSMRANVPCFSTELVDRTSYSSLHNQGGVLRNLSDVRGLDKAIANAEALAAEVLEVLVAENAA